jgi:hypothetical protein
MLKLSSIWRFVAGPRPCPKAQLPVCLEPVSIPAFSGHVVPIIVEPMEHRIHLAVPDLTASSISVSPSRVDPGGSIVVTYTLHNSGGAAAPQTQTKIRIVNPNNISQELTAPTFAEAGLAAGGSQQRSNTVPIPAGATAGTFQVRLVLDNQSTSRARRSP